MRKKQIDDFYSAYKRVRKPIPPPTRKIPHKRWEPVVDDWDDEDEWDDKDEWRRKWR